MEARISEAHEENEEIEDDRLRLIFTCCHPALSPEGQVALTLREICGLTTEEIARAFLVTTWHIQPVRICTAGSAGQLRLGPLMRKLWR
jgi:predicted RNA polymerase sigma factor